MRLGKFARMLSQGAGVTVLVAALSLAACGKSNAGSSKVVKFGSDLPTSGTDAGVGGPTQDGVQLAVNQAKLPNGYTLQYIPKNDVSTTTQQHDATVGTTNIQDLLSQGVVAILGPFNSGVAKAEIPLTNSAGVTLLSPANTNPGLTLQQYAQANGIDYAKLHPTATNCYFRLPGNDVVQGTLIADIALQAVPGKKPAYKTAFVVDDSETYGQGLAAYFTAEFKSKGGTIVGTASITAGQASALPALATQIKAKKPDFVMYGGVTSGGGGTLKGDLGPLVPMGGGDGIADDPAFLTAAGAGAINTFGTVAAPDNSGFTNPLQTAFVSAYKAAFPNDNLLPYSAQAYDGATIEINAISAVINAGQTPTAANVCAQVQKTDYTGVIGHITFDQNGDNSGLKVFSVYGVDQTGKWVFEQEVPVGQ